MLNGGSKSWARRLVKKDVGAHTDEWVPGSSSEWVRVSREMNMGRTRREMKIYSLPHAMEIQRD